jgi:dTDP-4-amino-4,6-dideoxygalactose transaminase
MSEFKVPFIDLVSRYEDEKEEILACVDRVLSKGHLVMTNEVEEFEEKVCRYTGAKYCVSLNSGTDALMIGMWALGIGKGDEVITSPVSFIASTGSIKHIGAKPVYVDVNDDQNIRVEDIEKAITPDTKAIMPVHWTGRIANMDEIIEIAEQYNLKIVEDSAQSMGAYYKGKHGGTMGDFGAVSAHPLKNLNAIGDGGFLMTDSEELYEKAKLYRNHGLRGRDDAAIFGVNSRLDVINAEILKFRLDKLESIIDKRRKNVKLYESLINTDKVYIPPETSDQKNSYVMFIIQAENRDELQEYLKSNGVQSLVYYGTPLHLHEASKSLGYKKGDFPVAESQCNKVLAIPHMQYLDDEQINTVAELINNFYQ